MKKVWPRTSLVYLELRLQLLHLQPQYFRRQMVACLALDLLNQVMEVFLALGQLRQLEEDSLDLEGHHLPQLEGAYSVEARLLHLSQVGVVYLEMLHLEEVFSGVSQVLLNKLKVVVNQTHLLLLPHRLDLEDRLKVGLSLGEVSRLHNKILFLELLIHL
jgi:hypothetical protein